MPRKGWTALETPNGWFQMIRGPKQMFLGASFKACRVGCRGLSVEGETCNDGGGASSSEGGKQGWPIQSGAPSAAGIPPMPHHVEEVEQWLMDRNGELRKALHFQDTFMIAHNGALIAKGASKLSAVEPVEGQSRSSLVAARTSEADAKRRCLEANSSYTSMVGSHVS